MIINFFSFNLGGLHDHEWSNEFKKTEWKELFISDCDIWCVCTQEDTEKSNFITALSSVLSGYTCLDKTPKKIILSNFNVHLAIFSKNNNSNTTLVKQKSLYHHVYDQTTLLNYFYHKSSAIIDYKNIRFVGSHLPFNPENSENASMRIKALNAILDLNKLDYMFIIGDLNFRINKDNKDQLTNFISNHTNIRDIGPGGKTCKMKIDRSQNCVNNTASPLSSSISNNTFNNTLQIERTRQFAPDEFKKIKQELESAKSGEIILETNCFVTKTSKGYRPPSLCDRILLVTTNTNYKIKESKIITIPPITQSDHNAIYTKFEIIIPSGGFKKYIKTTERLLIGKRNHIIYKYRNKKYIRKNNEYLCI
jgi:hypothetical protein